MVRRTILKAVGGHNVKIVPQFAKPEFGGIEQVRSQIRKHPRALVAPRGVPYQTCGAIAVEHAHAINPAELPRLNQFFHAHEMWLETVVIRGIADSPL